MISKSKNCIGVLLSVLLAVSLTAFRGGGGDSSSGTTTTDIPSAPTGVTASVGDGQVSISWSAASGATSYNIYWSTTSGVTKTSGTKITGATSPYSHTGLTNGTTYYYIVTAVNSSGECVESAQVLASPTAPAEGGVWSSLGSGLEYSVNSLALYNGNLYAASYGVHSWDGSKWTDMSNGMRDLFGGDVYALAKFKDVLFAGGIFFVLTPDGNWYNYVARFSNGSWTTCGSGKGNDGWGMSDPVNYLIEYNGQLYAGGRFGSAGGTPLNPRDAAYIARFDGAEWHPVGGGMDFTVTDMVVYNVDLIASGYFTRAAYLDSAGGLNPGSISANYIAKWNGISWGSLGGGMDGRVTALAVHNGELYAGGLFENAGGVPANSVAKWNGQSWSPVGNGITGGQVYTLASCNNELYAGGEFTTGGGNAGNYIMSWDGTQWKSVGSGTDGPVITLLPDSSGLIVGGSFSTGGNVSANNIAKYSVIATTVEQDRAPLPSTPMLFQNYPNPFNPSTQISYAIPTRSHVTLTVFNTLGQKIAELVNAEKLPGVYDVTFDASGLASGVYIYRMQAGGFVQTRKLIVVK